MVAVFGRGSHASWNFDNITLVIQNMDNKICFALVVPVASASARKNQTAHLVVRVVCVDQRQIFLFFCSTN